MSTPGIGPCFIAQNTLARWRTLRTRRIGRQNYAQCFATGVENGGISSKNGVRTALVGFPYRRFSHGWGWDPLPCLRRRPGAMLPRTRRALVRARARPRPSPKASFLESPRPVSQSAQSAPRRARGAPPGDFDLEASRIVSRPQRHPPREGQGCRARERSFRRQRTPLAQCWRSCHESPSVRNTRDG